MIEETIEWEDMVQAHKWNALHNAAQSMAERGGGFASLLAGAWRKQTSLTRERSRMNSLTCSLNTWMLVTELGLVTQYIKEHT